jgi:hypothetical protein
MNEADSDCEGKQVHGRCVAGSGGVGERRQRGEGPAGARAAKRATVGVRRAAAVMVVRAVVEELRREAVRTDPDRERAVARHEALGNEGVHAKRRQD